MTNITNNNPISTLDQLRNDIPLTRDFIYLQTGTYAPVPLSTQQYMADMLREENEFALGLGASGRGAEFYQQATKARDTLANLLGVASDEVAWTGNTTSATRLAVSSLPWKAGDKLAITDVEHVSTRSLVRAMKQLFGVETTVIPSGAGPTFSPDDFLTELERRLTPDHRLLIMCHVANTDGRRLPVAEATRIARSRQVKTLIDGAQAVGVIPVNVGEIGADFYSGSIHKWLMGPAGIGFLVVNRQQLPAYNPQWLPVSADQGEQPTAGGRTELGTPNYTLRLGAAYGIELLQRIGLPQIEQYVKELTLQLCNGLAEIKGIHVVSPRAWPLSSGITSFQLQDGSLEHCQTLVERLRQEHHIVTKTRPEICGIRLAVAAFNTAEEIDRLLEVLVTLV